MAVSAGYRDFVRGALGHYGNITDRAMFGGVTLYCDADAVAILYADQLFLKADEETLAEFEAAELEKFLFETKDGSTATMNYFVAPDDFFEDLDVMDRWMMLARAAGRRASAKRKSSQRNNRG
jgi:DNA transformation protein and related proteins